MNESANRIGPSDSEPNPPRGAPFEEFSDWLARQENETPEPISDNPSEKTHMLAGTTVEQRIFLSTLPYGLFWVATAFIAAHMTGHEIDSTRPMIGLGLLTWATSIGSEITRSYAMGDAYPTWGMWGWIQHPATTRLINKTQQAIAATMNDGRLLAIVGAVALPALFAGVYVFFAAISHARQLWMIFVVVTTGLHIGFTAHQCYATGKEKRDK
jgi:hypothetical protein